MNIVVTALNLPSNLGNALAPGNLTRKLLTSPIAVLKKKPDNYKTRNGNQL